MRIEGPCGPTHGVRPVHLGPVTWVPVNPGFRFREPTGDCGFPHTRASSDEVHFHLQEKLGLGYRRLEGLPFSGGFAGLARVPFMRC